MSPKIDDANLILGKHLKNPSVMFCFSSKLEKINQTWRNHLHKFFHLTGLYFLYLDHFYYHVSSRFMQSRFSSASLSFMSADRTFQKLFLWKTVEWILIAFYNVSPMSCVKGGVCIIQNLTIIPKIKCYCHWIQIYLSSKRPNLSYYFTYSWGEK